MALHHAPNGKTIPSISPKAASAYWPTVSGNWTVTQC